MSAPMESGSESPASGQIETGAAPAATPVSGPAATTTASASTKGQSPPGFDWERDAREARSRYDKRENELKPLLQVVQRLGLDPVKAAMGLENFERVLQNQDVRPMVLQALNGLPVQAPKAQPDAGPDVYVDPDIKALEEKYEQKFSALQRQLEEMSNTTRQSASVQVSQTIQGYERDFLSRYPTATEEERRAFGEAFMQRFDWMAKNNPAALLSLQKETYKNMALPVLDEVVPGGIEALVERSLAQRRGEIAGRATDARLRTQTTGNESVPNAQAFDKTPTPNDLQRVAREAVERLRREKGYSGPVTR